MPSVIFQVVFSIVQTVIMLANGDSFLIQYSNESSLHFRVESFDSKPRKFRRIAKRSKKRFYSCSGMLLRFQLELERRMVPNRIGNQGYADNQVGPIRPASTFSFEEYFFEESLPPTRPYLCILVSSAFFEKEKNSERYKNGCNSRSIDCIRSNLDTRNRIEACRLRLLMEN